MKRNVLIGYLPPLEGLPKTGASYAFHRSLVNIGDIAYTYAGTVMVAGRDYTPWNFSLTAEEVNERFTHVVFFIPCRVAEPPFDRDGYPFETATAFVERLRIPFVTVCESVQSADEDYHPAFHTRLAPEVVRYLRVLADRSPLVGTRGYYSAEVLHKLGIRNVRAVGCPSLYLNGPALSPRLLARRPFSEIRQVAVSYTNYQFRPRTLIREILALAADRGYFYVEQSFNLVTKLLYYVGKIEAADLLEAHQWYGRFDELRALYAGNRIRYFTNFTLWKTFLSRMDYVFGSRMHGQTPAIQEGIPATFIVHDSRVREMVEFFRLPAVSERTLLEEGLDPQRLYDSCDYSEAAKAYPELYRGFLDFLTEVGLPPRCDGEGRILEPFEPQPGPGVESELDPSPPRQDLSLRFLDLLFDMGRQMVAQGSVEGFEGAVSDLVQLWYQVNQAVG